MNPKRESTRTDERGIALMSVVLLMLVVSALTAALAVSAQTEVLVSRNHQSAAQAHMAAEAGLNHAASTVVANLARWEANGFATSSAAMSRLLRGPDDLNGTAPTDLDNGSLEVLGIPRSPARTALGTMPGVAYEARIFDEDDPLRGVTLAPTDLARIQENAVATADNNRRLVVRATGYALNGTRVVLDAIVGTVTLPAVVTNGDLTVNGNPTVIGLAGGIHSNEDLELLGSPSIAQQATASLDYSTTGNPVVGGELGGSFPHLWIPPVKASDYRWRADFILTAGGLITTNPDARPPVALAVLCNASAVFNACRPAWGWVYRGPGNGWDITGNSGANGTYYVEGPVNISGNPGSNLVPLVITLIAEGRSTSAAIRT